MRLSPLVISIGIVISALAICIFQWLCFNRTIFYLTRSVSASLKDVALTLCCILLVSLKGNSLRKLLLWWKEVLNLHHFVLRTLHSSICSSSCHILTLWTQMSSVFTVLFRTKILKRRNSYFNRCFSILLQGSSWTFNWIYLLKTCSNWFRSQT